MSHLWLHHALWTEAFWASVVGGGLVAGVPLMFASIGETISERSGVLNIGLEGMMLFGAYAGFLGAYYGHTQWLGYLGGGLAGMAASVLMVVLCVWLGLDQIVVGIAITLAGGGITSVLQEAEFGASYPRLGATSTLNIPLLDRLPIVGTTLFEQPPIVYLGFAFIGVLTWAFANTNIGLNLRAAGEKPEALDAAGVSVVATRSYAVLATGFLAGLGGAYLAIVGAGIFTPFISQGQGYMAIVIAMLGRGRPLWVLFGSLLFGVSLSLSDSLQIAGYTISTDLVNALPFAAIIAALIIFARRSYLPPALAQPYVRGTR
jgi:simple sugar transport system permease protein